MAGPLVHELNNLEREGVRVYDAYLRQEVLVTAPVLCIICDNYRAAEITNSLGPSSRMFCRICMVIIYSVVVNCVYIVNFAVYRRTERATQLYWDHLD